MNLDPTLLLAQGLQLKKEASGKGASCEANNGFCPQWIGENWERYVNPFWEHLFLVIVPVAIGFAIAFSLGLYAHRHRWAMGPSAGITGAMYTVPSIAFFFLLQPITGLGNVTAIIALTCYTLLIIFRNVTVGLAGVPEDTKDAALGMGLTDRQLLWKVEVPLAMPEILAGLRIATTTTVGLAALAFLAGGYGGLGLEIDQQREFKSNIIVAGGLCVFMAAVLELLVLGFQKLVTPWERAKLTS